MELARALAGQPRLLLLDETLAGLGTNEAAEVVAVLRKLAGEGITIVIIEHTMQAMVRLVDRFVVLDHGAVLMEGEPETVTRDPRVIEAYLGKKWSAYAQGREHQRRLFRSCRCSRTYRSTVGAGEFVAVVGPNGAGKTTLFKTISGTLRPLSRHGSSSRASISLAVPPSRRPHLGIAHVPEGRQVFPSLTVMENLEMGAYTEAGRRDWKRQYRAHPRLAAGAGGSARPVCRHAVGRRAADGGDRARPRLLAQAADARRAVDGTRADHRRFHLRAS